MAEWYRDSDFQGPNRLIDSSYTAPDMAWFGQPMMDGLRETARRLPTKIAIDDGALRLSYAQLYAMACRLSHALSRPEVLPGPVGIKLSYDVMHTVALFGCMAAARPSVLMSRDHPPDYSRRLADAAGATAIIVNAADARDGSRPDEPLLIPIESILVPSDDDDTRPAARLDVDETAFILSTSGSTGTPKLIGRWQRRLQQSARQNISYLQLSESDRFLVVGGPTNGAAVRSLPFFMIGATVHLVDARRDGMSGIMRAVRDGQVTVLNTTVSMMKALSQLPDARAHLRSLRMVSVGGEMLLQKDLTQIRAVLSAGCRVGYSLSMTETPVAKWIIPETDDHDPVRVAVGYLQTGTEVLVLGDDGRPCPPGEIGELIVRGDRVAHGEWRGGKLVQDRFQADSAANTKRIYRTGDMVRICPDGVMVVHGRKDRMIKIRGQRVEPAAIEATMRDIPGVANAAVVARPVDGGYSLHGFVVPDKPDVDRDGLPAKVRAALKVELPVYMQLYDIRAVDALPISGSGKVDSAALLQHLSAGGTESVQPAPVIPSVATRRSRDWVADAWRVAFGSAKDATLGFEAAGGDSLQFMQIIFRLEQLSGISLPLGGFSNAMSQDDMALTLDRLLGGGREAPTQGTPVFFIPGVGGDEPRLLRFRAGCAPGVCFHCLDYGDWPQWVAPGFTLDEILERLVARVQDELPSGPVILAGYSLGGQVALALGAKLREAGREIGHVLILDSEPIALSDNAMGARRAAFAPPMSWRDEWREWQTAHRRGEGAFALSLIVVRRLVSPRWAPLLRWIARHRRTVLPGQIDFYLTFHLHRCILLGLAANWRKSLMETPRIVAPITVFKVGERDDRGAMAWEKHASRTALIYVGGDHFTMFDPPHLADLCAQFTAACTAKPIGELAAS